MSLLVFLCFFPRIKVRPIAVFQNRKPSARFPCINPAGQADVLCIRYPNPLVIIGFFYAVKLFKHVHGSKPCSIDGHPKTAYNTSALLCSLIANERGIVAAIDHAAHNLSRATRVRIGSDDSVVALARKQAAIDKNRNGKQLILPLLYSIT
jgi:hypothetical protein